MQINNKTLHNQEPTHEREQRSTEGKRTQIEEDSMHTIESDTINFSLKKHVIEYKILPYGYFLEVS